MGSVSIRTIEHEKERERERERERESESELMVRYREEIYPEVLLRRD